MFRLPIWGRGRIRSSEQGEAAQGRSFCRGVGVRRGALEAGSEVGD